MDYGNLPYAESYITGPLPSPVHRTEQNNVELTFDHTLGFRLQLVPSKLLILGPFEISNILVYYQKLSGIYNSRDLNHFRFFFLFSLSHFLSHYKRWIDKTKFECISYTKTNLVLSLFLISQLIINYHFFLTR